MTQNYKNLIVWKRAHEITIDVYKITKGFPAEEKFGLVQQIRRAASSIELNIAEGTVGSDKRFQNYLIMSLGSCKETECILLLCKELEYLNVEKYDELIKKVGILLALLQNLLKTVRRSEN